MSEQTMRPHTYAVGEHVILTNGLVAVIISQWWEDSGTPGYGVEYMDPPRSRTGIHDVHIIARVAEQPEGGVRR